MQTLSNSTRGRDWAVRLAEFHARRSPLRSRAAQRRHCNRFLARARRRGLLTA